MDPQMHCPHCGKPIDEASKAMSIPWMVGFEYRSKSSLFGMPLIHLAFGYNPHTGFPHIARGVIAIGNFALGVVAIGGIAAGGFVLSGIGIGVIVIAGIAAGWAAIGGIAIGAAFALGGLAISLGHATGGLPIILNCIVSDHNDARAL